MSKILEVTLSFNLYICIMSFYDFMKSFLIQKLEK